MRKMIWKIPAKNCGERSPHSEDRHHTKLTCFEALRAKNLDCQILSFPTQFPKNLSYTSEQNRTGQTCLFILLWRT